MLLSAFLDLELPDGSRAELIDGEIHVSPLPDGDHQHCVGALNRQIALGSTAHLYASQNKGLVTPRGRFIPDSTIGPRGLFRRMDSWAQPDGVVMVAEVTSSRPDKDRGPKRRGYAGAGIPYYLLVDRSESTVTLYATPQDADYREITRVPFGKPLDLPEPFGFTLDTAIFD